MKFLQKKASRVTAFIISCVLTALCAISVINMMINHNSFFYGKSYYNLNECDYSDEIYDLYRNLWLTGNMYLRYFNADGSFNGTPELEKSIKEAMKKHGLMNSKGELILSEKDNFEYYVACGDNSYSNVKKTYDEIYNENYSFVRKNGENYYPKKIEMYIPGDNSYHWYTTNYGLSYFYCGDKSTAIFDYNTDKLNYYIDDFNVKIYYKADGTTPISLDESYDERNYTYSNETLSKEISGDDDEKGFFVFNNDTGEWIHIYPDDFIKTPGQENDITICISLKKELIASYEKMSVQYEKEKKEDANQIAIVVIIGVIALILTIYVIIADGYSIKDRKYLMSKRKIYPEIAVACLIIASIGLYEWFEAAPFEIIYLIEDYFSSWSYLVQIMYGVITAILYAVIILMLNSVIRSIKCKKLWNTTLIKKIISYIRRKLLSKELMKNDILMRKFIMRTIVYVAADIFTIMIFRYRYRLPIVCLVLITFVYIAVCFQDLCSLKELGEQISDMNSGDYSTRDVPESYATYGIVQKLNNISGGIQSAVDTQVKSERMKIDLVTNVSHDLKTPLTSIISYIDLLAMEELTPEASDYVKIISEKSEHLKTIVADLFDLAKATSQTDIKFEMIDAVILVAQVLGDLSDKIIDSDNEIRTDIAMSSAPIYADGSKLYRVMQNLIDNALKYSLNGTRIYLRLYEENQKVVIMIKNIASYEMNFNPEEITERFTRGDKARTTEGNGLGLSIAKSFTEACGGTFTVITDDDVFTAKIELNLVHDTERQTD